MNRTVIGALAIASLTVIALYVLAGGQFDAHFSREALVGLMGNLAAVALAAFVIDRILREQRETKYKEENRRRSQTVLLQTNIYAFKLLEHFGLVSLSDASSTALNGDFEYNFATDKLKEADISMHFLDKVLTIPPEEKVKYIESFAELIKSHTEALLRCLDDIYPRPDPTLMRDWDQADAMVRASAMLPEAYIGANRIVIAKDRLSPDQLNLLIKVGNSLVAKSLKSLTLGLVQLAKRSRENNLFITFD